MKIKATAARWIDIILVAVWLNGSIKTRTARRTAGSNYFKVSPFLYRRYKPADEGQEKHYIFDRLNFYSTEFHKKREILHIYRPRNYYKWDKK